MLRFCKIFGCLICCTFIFARAFALDLSGKAVVSITSDTAVSAKNIAMAEARRQIITDKLGQYADREQLKGAIENNKDLTGLISQTSIEGEKISDTMYDATIYMTVDAVAAQQWLDQNGVQNWLQTSNADIDTVMVKITFSMPVADWADFNSVVKDNKINYQIHEMFGNTAIVSVPKKQRGTFTAALHGKGWKYSAKDDNLSFWK